MDNEFKLKIDCENLPANELATMLSNLDKSFKSFGRRHYGQPFKSKLTVAAVRYGSLEVLLEVAGAIKTLLDAKDILAPFATHLAELIGIHVTMSKNHLSDKLQVANHSSDKFSSADRNAVKSLAGPVANGNASQINIVNNGTILLNVENKETAQAILDGLDLSNLTSKLMKPIEHALGAVNHEISNQQLKELADGQLMGTAFIVDGTWYARLESGQGVLVPISLLGASANELRNGTTYAFRGTTLRGTKGEIIGLAMNDAKPI